MPSKVNEKRWMSILIIKKLHTINKLFEKLSLRNYNINIKNMYTEWHETFE